MAADLLDKYGNAIEKLTLIPSSGGVYAVSYTHLTLPTTPYV